MEASNSAVDPKDIVIVRGTARTKAVELCRDAWRPCSSQYQIVTFASHDYHLPECTRLTNLLFLRVEALRSTRTLLQDSCGA